MLGRGSNQMKPLIDYSVEVVNILKEWDFDKFENYFGSLRLELSLVPLIEVQRESNYSPMMAALCIYGFFYTAYMKEKKDALRRKVLTIH